MKLRLSFDLDETLVRTEDLVRSSYMEAGLTFTDEEWYSNVWGHAWYEWLPHHPQVNSHIAAEEIHDIKNKAYVRRLATIKPQLLPPYKLFGEEYEAGRAPVILTSASQPAAEAVLRSLGLPVLHCLGGAGLTKYDKRAFVRQYPNMIHIDNAQDVTEVFDEEDIPCVLYTGDGLDKLKKSVAAVAETMRDILDD